MGKNQREREREDGTLVYYAELRRISVRRGIHREEKAADVLVVTELLTCIVPYTSLIVSKSAPPSHDTEKRPLCTCCCVGIRQGATSSFGLPLSYIAPIVMFFPDL